ncbi:MAG: stage V sporulation protein AE [Clostridiaceae bacterium]|nr:stage V sporulation protein AE [Clostridiaceae bacterium]
MDKKRVILVTDGDTVAQSAVETAAHNIGGRCISLSSGNPTVLSGEEIVEQISKAEHDPVVVMVDDCGDLGAGRGEKAMLTIMNNPEIEVLGVVAVASNGKEGNSVKVDCSITKDGKKINHAVDKNGNELPGQKIYGDTLGVLRYAKVPLIVGIGDPGKMDGKDDVSIGAPITTAALREILNAASNKGTEIYE